MTCPICGKDGSLTNRWVTSSYRPQYASMIIDHDKDTERFRGTKYRGPSKKFVINPDVSEIEDRNEIKKHYLVRSKKYIHYYVGHYNKEKYIEQLLRYRSGIRKSRPNGREWHYLKRWKHYRFEVKDSIEWFLIKEYRKRGFIGVTLASRLKNKL